MLTWEYGEGHCDRYEPVEKTTVHQHLNGTWWFYDETLAQELGPFATEAEATVSFDKYCEAM